MNKSDLTFSTNGSIANSTFYRLEKRNRNLIRLSLGVCLVVVSIVLSACASAASTPTQLPTAPSIGVSQSTETSTPSPIPTSTSAPQPAAVNTSLDPCQLISSQDASTLTGATFGPGKEGTNPDGLKSCTYIAQPSNTFIVEVIQAASVDEANADKEKFLADIQANAQQISSEGLVVTQVPNFADGAIKTSANISEGGITFSGNVFGFLKGTIFVGFSDTVIGGTAPSDAAMQAEASAVLGKLP